VSGQDISHRDADAGSDRKTERRRFRKDARSEKLEIGETDSGVAIIERRPLRVKELGNRGGRGDASCMSVFREL
jgi:hypothetical protein